ncbi:hypothetical protein ACHAXS_001989, partial [Conticribra weissflogii]
RWSPITCITPTKLSPSGLILLESNAGEVETLVRTNVELRYNGSGPLPLQQQPQQTSSRPSSSRALPKGPWTPIDTQLNIHITTHRIVFLSEQTQRQSLAGSIPHPQIHTVLSTGGPTLLSPRSSHKIHLSTLTYGDLLIVFRGGENNSYSQSAKDRDDVFAAIQQARKRKAWQDGERAKMKEQLRPSRGVVGRKVGVDAIETRNAMRHEENATLAEEAFSGGSALGSSNYTSSSGKGGIITKKMGGSSAFVGNISGRKNTEAIDRFLIEAGELTKVIQSYVAKIERERAASTAAATSSSAKSNTDPEANTSDDTAKLVNMLENMGMTSALSAKESGSIYHKQLSRQLVDFLRKNDKLSKAGGMMTLTDVYCLFNRARGTNLISPEDLLKSLDWMQKLKLGMSKRVFEKSGVVVIQDDSFDDEVMAKKLAALASESLNGDGVLNNEPNDKAGSSLGESAMKIASRGVFVGGITALDVSKSLKISAMLANEQLLSAEQMGWLCRDSTIEGIRFFPNCFSSGDFSSFGRFPSKAVR